MHEMLASVNLLVDLVINYSSNRMFSSLFGWRVGSGWTGNCGDTLTWILFWTLATCSIPGNSKFGMHSEQWKHMF